jgi:hypothetical protein
MIKFGFAKPLTQIKYGKPLKILKRRLKTVDTRTAHPEPRAYQPVYYSRAWRRLVAQLKLQRGEFCQASASMRPISKPTTSSS